MIGKRYWSSGILLSHLEGDDPYWHGTAGFYDDGFADDDPAAGRISTHGELRTHYFVRARNHQESLRLVIDTLRTDAEALGIEFRDPYLYAAGDGEDPAHPMPEGWRDLLREQADRVGWRLPYRTDEED